MSKQDKSADVNVNFNFQRVKLFYEFRYKLKAFEFTRALLIKM
jgi:hypothetical protein